MLAVCCPTAYRHDHAGIRGMNLGSAMWRLDQSAPSLSLLCFSALHGQKAKTMFHGPCSWALGGESSPPTCMLLGIYC